MLSVTSKVHNSERRLCRVSHLSTLYYAELRLCWVVCMLSVAILSVFNAECVDMVSVIYA
jgi:hypothetical protein